MLEENSTALDPLLVNRATEQPIDELSVEWDEVKKLFVGAAAVWVMSYMYNQPTEVRKRQIARLIQSVSDGATTNDALKEFFNPSSKDKLVLSAAEKRKRELQVLIKKVSEEVGHDSMFNPESKELVQKTASKILNAPENEKLFSSLRTVTEGWLPSVVSDTVEKHAKENGKKYVENMSKIKQPERENIIRGEQFSLFETHMRGDYRSQRLATKDKNVKNALENEWNEREEIYKILFKLVATGQLDNLDVRLRQEYVRQHNEQLLRKLGRKEYVLDAKTEGLLKKVVNEYGGFIQKLGKSAEQQIKDLEYQLTQYQQQAAAQIQQKQSSSHMQSLDTIQRFKNIDFGEVGKFGSKAMEWGGRIGGQIAEKGFNGLLRAGGSLFGGGGAAAGGVGVGAGAAGTAAAGAGAAAGAAGTAGALGAGAGAAALATSEIWVPLLIIGVVVLIIVVAIFFIAMNMTTTTSQPYALQAEKTPIVYTISKNNTGNLSALFGELPPLSPKAFAEGEVIKTKCLPNKDTYQKAQADTGLPWELFAAIHYIEGQCEEDRSLVSGRKSIKTASNYDKVSISDEDAALGDVTTNTSSENLRTSPKSATGVPQCEPDIERFHTCNTEQQNPGDPVLGECKPDGKDEAVRQGCVFNSLEASALYSAINMKGLAGDKTPEVLEDFAKMISRRSGGGNRNCSDELPNTRTNYSGCPRLYEGEDDAYVMNWMDAKHETMYIIYQEDLKQLSKDDALLWQRPGVLTIMRLLSEE